MIILTLTTGVCISTQRSRVPHYCVIELTVVTSVPGIRVVVDCFDLCVRFEEGCVQYCVADVMEEVYDTVQHD